MSGILLLALFLLSGGAQTPSMRDSKATVIIANKTNRLDSISRSQLKIIYLRKVSRWPWGAETVPVDLPHRHPTRDLFVKTVLDSNVEDLAVYWIDQKVTRNVDPPVEAGSPDAVKALVASRPGAIAYIPAAAVDSTVKVLEVR